jgi:hypothetical protein
MEWGYTESNGECQAAGPPLMFSRQWHVVKLARRQIYNTGLALKLGFDYRY